jgi:mannosyltransferase
MDVFVRRIKRLSDRQKDIFIIGFASALYSLLASIKLGSWPIWFDEGFTRYITQFSFRDIGYYSAQDIHPPLFYWLLKVWEFLFGNSAFAMRSLSVLFGIGVIIIGYILIKKLFDRRSASWALMLLVLSPMFVRYGQEARMYTLAALFFILATFFLVKANEQTIAKKRSKYWLLYALAIAAGFWTHYFVILAWLGHWLWRGLMIQRSHQKSFFRHFFNIEWLKVNSWIAILFFPWLFVMVAQFIAARTGNGWHQTINQDTLVNTIAQATVYTNASSATGWLSAVVYVTLIIIIVAGSTMYRRASEAHKQALMLLWCCGLTQIGILFLLGLPPFSIGAYYDRYLLPAMVCLSLVSGVVLAAHTVTKQKRWMLASLIIIVTLCVGQSNNMSYALHNTAYQNQYDGTKLMHYVGEHDDQTIEPIVVTNARLFYVLSFYQTDQHPVVFVKQDKMNEGSEAMLYRAGAHDTISSNQLVTYTSRFEQVWYVTYEEGTNKPLPPVVSWQEQTTYVYKSAHDTTTRATKYLIQKEK